MQEIRLIGCDELVHVQDIVYRTWPDTYGKILSRQQIDYMLQLFYNLPALEKSMEQDHLYHVFFEDGIPLGFIDVQPNTLPEALKLHKLYVLPDNHGKRIGKQLFQKAEEIAKVHGMKRLYLNVNRSNNAIEFYRAMGLQVLKEEDVDIGNGYLMEDFVMEKILD